MSEVKRIRVLLRTIYHGRAWHGPAIHETLAGVTAEAAAARPIVGAHSIWELVLHMAYWRQVVIEALDGGPVDEHPPAELDWPPVGDPSQEAWQRSVEGLERSQKTLVGRLAEFDDERLAEKIADREYSFYFLLHGIIQHDLYHLGQIALLKKAAA